MKKKGQMTDRYYIRQLMKTKILHYIPMSLIKLLGEPNSAKSLYPPYLKKDGLHKPIRFITIG
jgi:hypothetical protein